MSNTESIDLKSAFEFAQWCGWNYVRFHETWVGKYSNSSDRKNWRTTPQLYEYWLETKKL